MLTIQKILIVVSTFIYQIQRGGVNDIVISDTVLRKACKFHSFEHLDHFVRSLDMADTIPSETETTTELLIGNDYCLDIILSQTMKSNLVFICFHQNWVGY